MEADRGGGVVIDSHAAVQRRGEDEDCESSKERAEAAG